jgi:hypothetical protein
MSIGYTYPACVVVNVTHVADCGGGWHLTLADIESFVAFSAFPSPAYSVYTMRFDPTPASGGGVYGAAARFIVWDNGASTAVIPTTVLSQLARSCAVVTTATLLGLCNFTASGTNSSGGGFTTTTPVWGGGGGLLPTASPSPAGEDDAASVAASDAASAGTGSTPIVVGAVIAALALLIVGVMVVVKMRSNRIGSGGISGPAMTFTNPTFKKQIEAENARIAGGSLSTPEAHGSVPHASSCTRCLF